MSQNPLDIIIRAKNEARPTLEQVKADLRGIDATAKMVSGGIGGVLAVGGVAGLVVLGTKIAEVGVEMAGMATQMRRVNLAALEMAGSQEKLNSLLDVYMRVTGGMATRGQALAELARLQAVGFADTAEELERFLTAARGASIATGQSIDYIIGQLQLTIANMSTMRLDQLGLGVGEIKKRIDALRASNAGMTQETAYQEAVLGALIDKYGALVTSSEAAATGTERLSRAVAQLREDAANVVGPAVDAMAGAVADLMMGAELPTINLDNLQRALEEIRDAAHPTTTAWIQAQQALNALNGDMSAESLRALSMAMQGNLLDAEQARDGAMKFAQSLTIVGDRAVYGASQLAQFSAMAVQAQREVFAASVALTRAAQAGVESIGSSLFNRLGAEGTLSWVERQTEAVQQQVRGWQEAGYTIDQIQGVLLPGYLSGLRESNRELTKAVQTAPQLSEEFQKLKGIVEGVLRGALDPGVGVDPEGILAALGLREDAVNENARRLADIAARGLADQDWLGRFAEEAPNIWEAIRLAADPQAEAAYLLRDFQMGLRPELIDKERAKELIKKMLVGDQRMAELAAEIAGELAMELGVPLHKALTAAQGALGMSSEMGEVAAVTAGAELKGKLLPVGEDTAISFVVGFERGLSEIGVKTADILDKQILGENVARLIGDTGAGAGRVWGEGFLHAVGENVPAALIDILFMKIMPMVQGSLATESALTGAQ